MKSIQPFSVMPDRTAKTLMTFTTEARSLYRTNKGSWFIRYFNGDFTDMGVVHNGSGRGSSKFIDPLSDDAAFEFFENLSDESDAQSIELQALCRSGRGSIMVKLITSEWKKLAQTEV